MQKNVKSELSFLWKITQLRVHLTGHRKPGETTASTADFWYSHYECSTVLINFNTTGGTVECLHVR